MDMSAYVLRQLAQANCMPHPPVQTPGSGEGGQGSRGKVRPHTVNVAVLQRRKYHDRPESDGSLRTEQNSQTPFRCSLTLITLLGFGTVTISGIVTYPSILYTIVKC